MYICCFILLFDQNLKSYKYWLLTSANTEWCWIEYFFSPLMNLCISFLTLQENICLIYNLFILFCTTGEKPFFLWSLLSRLRSSSDSMQWRHCMFHWLQIMITNLILSWCGSFPTHTHTHKKTCVNTFANHRNSLWRHYSELDEHTSMATNWIGSSITDQSFFCFFQYILVFVRFYFQHHTLIKRVIEPQNHNININISYDT